MRDLNRLGRIASIRYKGGVKGEEAIDDRSTGAPLRVILGERHVPKGIEDLLYEMEVGESRVVDIPCELGYGEYNPQGVQWYPRTFVDGGYKLETGSVLTWTSPEDFRRMPVRVIDATDDAVKIDFNHPFAGKTLEYWIELVDLEQGV